MGINSWFINQQTLVGGLEHGWIMTFHRLGKKNHDVGMIWQITVPSGKHTENYGQIHHF